ncbi:uncharacterized protein LOC144682414 isoform X2 [Cetorhinus maximus]
MHDTALRNSCSDILELRGLTSNNHNHLPLYQEKTSHYQLERSQTGGGLSNLLLLTRFEQDILELGSWHAPCATRHGEVGVPDEACFTH